MGSVYGIMCYPNKERFNKCALVALIILLFLALLFTKVFYPSLSSEQQNEGVLWLVYAFVAAILAVIANNIRAASRLPSIIKLGMLLFSIGGTVIFVISFIVGIYHLLFQ